MRILCSTFGSSGDVFPILGLAIELKARGHDVALATNEYYAAVAKRYAIQFEPLGNADDFRRVAADPALWNPRRAFAHLYRHLLPVMKEQYALHERWLARGQFLSVSNCLSFGSRLAHERLHIPLLSLHLQPVVFQSRIQPPYLGSLYGPKWLRYLLFRIGERLILDRAACPSLNAWREELGLPPIKRITHWWHSPMGSICLFPKWFAAPQVDWPGPISQTDFPLWNDQSRSEHSTNELSPDVQKFLEAGDPPIVMAPGSMNLHGRQFFQQAVDACRSLDRRAILLTEFPEQLPPDLPPSIASFDYIPLDLLLPRAAMIVHHGGIGTTSQAMLAGIPQIAMPMAHDQYDNAVRIMRLGVGRAIPDVRFTAARLRHAIQALSNDKHVLGNCQSIAARLQPRNGLASAADVISTVC